MGQYNSLCSREKSVDVGPEPPSYAWTVMDAESYSVYETVTYPTNGRDDSSVPEDSPYVTYPRRRLAVIFNHEKFDPSLQLSRRVGTEIDLNSLSKVLKELKFEVNIYADLPYEDIKKRLQEVSEEERSGCDCLMVVVMTHGLEKGRLYAYDRVYLSSALWTPFMGDKCTSLVGKPKIFVIQACRGTGRDFGVKPLKQAVPECMTDGGDGYTIPVTADFFIAYSSSEGYVSWRERNKGSWFIQELCNCLRAYHRSLDFQRIMTKVGLRVATDYESHPSIIAEFNTMKQMPNTHSTLRHDVYFY